VHALAGAHVDVSGVTTRRRVLFEVHLPNALNGAWVRVWPEGFDDRNGVHVRTDGGGGRARSQGSGDAIAYVVATLADGPASSPAPPAVNFMVVATDSSASATAPRLVSRIYSDKRFTRPAAPSPDTLAPAPSGSTSWVICETGEQGTGSLAGRAFGGATIIVQASGGGWALVDRSALSPADLAPPSGGGTGTAQTLGAKIASTDILELTQTAFMATPDHLFPTGDPAPSSSAVSDATDGLGTRAVVDRCMRASVANPAALLAASTPFAAMERLDIAAASFGASGTAAAIGGVPTLGPYHELLPHDVGHPGAPGAVEIHGTGVRLDGPAAIPLLEAVRDRTAGLGSGTGLSWVAGLDPAVKALVLRSTPLLAIEALTALPSPAAPDLGTALKWAAVLRTVAAGVEGEPGGASGIVAAGLYPFSATQATIASWLTQQVSSWTGSLGSGGSGVLGQLQSALTNATAGDAIYRALDRRVKSGKFGLREAAWSLVAAIGRAESFVYIETPAFDHQRCGPITAPTATDPSFIADPVAVWDALVARMGQRPGLRVVICAPIHLMPGTPQRLEDVRNSMLLKAMSDLKGAGADRIAFFSPAAGSGRTIRLATTTVVVDDAWALTGTTHLSRRGLSYDSSLAAAVFDDTIDMGRPKEVRDFRRALLAGRLGLPVGLVPDDPVELVRSIAELARRGSIRLATDVIAPPPPPTVASVSTTGANGYPTSADEAAWNPNGGETTLTFASILAALEQATAETGVDAAVSPAS
jgi:hypothetical protein